MIVEGQVHGGIIQGVAAGALRGGRLRRRGASSSPTTLLDYLVPSAAELPTFELDRTVTPSPTNPLGVKGMGETGTIAVDACRHQRRRRRALAPRRHRHRAARDARTSLASDRGGGDSVIPAAFDYDVAEIADHAIELLGRDGRTRS